MSTGKFALTDIDKPKGGKFSASDVAEPKKTGWEPVTNLPSYGESLLQGMKEEGDPRARIEAGKATLVGAGTMLAPELLPEMAGGGVLGFLGRVLARAGMSGIGAGAGNMAGTALTGKNPVSPESLRESGKLALFTTALATPLEFIGQLPTTKLGRSAINQSLGAQTRDVTYGNPAKALTDEGITDISTGDYEAYKDALRAGKTPEEAAAKAGGRFSAVAQRINEYGPRLERMLANKPASIPVANVISKPLDNAMIDIIDNGAMTDTEKLQAYTQLDDLKKSMLSKVPGPMATPSELQILKQQMGNRINWQGTVGVTDEVRPAYRQVYSSLKQAINLAVPDAAPINEKLTNLLSAFSDLDTLARAEEVGRGSGVTRGKMGIDLLGMLQGEAGRVLPAAANAPAAIPVGATIAQQLQSKGVPVPQPNAPALPFRPGAGISKPRTQQ